jgi:hypothetical protein
VKYSDAVQVVDGPIEQPVRPTCPHSTAARLSRNTRSLARFPGAVFRAYFSQLRLHMWMGRVSDRTYPLHTISFCSFLPFVPGEICNGPSRHRLNEPNTNERCHLKKPDGNSSQPRYATPDLVLISSFGFTRPSGPAQTIHTDDTYT